MLRVRRGLHVGAAGRAGSAVGAGPVGVLSHNGHGLHVLCTKVVRVGDYVSRYIGVCTGGYIGGYIGGHIGGYTGGYARVGGVVVPVRMHVGWWEHPSVAV
eukprot:3584804-Pleurochrysis_carterae.AAC.2